MTELSERIRRNTHANLDGWIVRLMTEAADEIDRVTDERRWFESQLGAVRGELNGMALIGVQPTWESLIGRLDQMIAEAKARSS